MTNSRMNGKSPPRPHQNKNSCPKDLMENSLPLALLSGLCAEKSGREGNEGVRRPPLLVLLGVDRPDRGRLSSSLSLKLELLVVELLLLVLVAEPRAADAVLLLGFCPRLPRLLARMSRKLLRWSPRVILGKLVLRLLIELLWLSSTLFVRDFIRFLYSSNDT